MEDTHTPKPREIPRQLGAHLNLNADLTLADLRWFVAQAQHLPDETDILLDVDEEYNQIRGLDIYLGEDVNVEHRTD